MLKFPGWILLWAVFLVLKLFVLATGYIMVAFLYRYRDVDYTYLPWWTRPWSNLEDWQGGANAGISSGGFVGTESQPHWWVRLYESKLTFWSFYKYHAIRNGAGGMRSFKFLSANLLDGNIKYWTPFYMAQYEPHKLRELGKRFSFYIAWQGWQAGFRIGIVWTEKYHASMKFGWRIEPRHAVVGLTKSELALMKRYPKRRIIYTNRGFSSGFHPIRKG